MSSSPEILSPIYATSRSPNVSLVDSSPSSRYLDKLTCAEIQSMLKAKPDQYIIIGNTGKHTSDCWTAFGFPAIISSEGDPERINGFVSCRKCFTTYSFVSNNTRLLNQHDCEISKERNRRLSASTTSPAQRRLTTFYPAQLVALKPSEIMKIKDLKAEWVCKSVRQFSIVEDDGLRRLIKECISIGK